MKNSEIKSVSRLIFTFFMLLPIFIVFLEYLLDYFLGFSFSFKKADQLAAIGASLSFTLLGILSAISTFVFSLNRYPSFRRWVNSGKLKIFNSLYLSSIANLFVVFFSSVLVYTNALEVPSFKIMLAFMFVAMLQVSLITYIMIQNVSKADLFSD